MPESWKVPLVLHDYQALSLAEVASVLEMPKSTVQHVFGASVSLEVSGVG